MPPHTVITTMLGGLLGTVAQSMVVYGVGPLIANPSLDRAALGGSPCALGLLLHLLSGSVLFPLGFLALPAHAVPGPPVLRGMLWAGCLWLALETLVAPLLSHIEGLWMMQVSEAATCACVLVFQNPMRG